MSEAMIIAAATAAAQLLGRALAGQLGEDQVRQLQAMAAQHAAEGVAAWEAQREAEAHRDLALEGPAAGEIADGAR